MVRHRFATVAALALACKSQAARLEEESAARAAYYSAVRGESDPDDPVLVGRIRRACLACADEERCEFEIRHLVSLGNDLHYFGGVDRHTVLRTVCVVGQK